MYSQPLQVSQIIYQQALSQAIQLTDSYEHTLKQLDAAISPLRDTKTKLVLERLLSIMQQEEIKAVFLFYDKDIYQELIDHSHGRLKVTVIQDLKTLAQLPSSFDLLFTGSNWLDYENLGFVLPFIERNDRPGVSTVWLWDHHHMIAHSLQLAALFDIVVPIHENRVNYLKSVNGLVTSAIPPACYQWSKPEAERFFYDSLKRERSNSLYGGFRSYDANFRNILINDCIQNIPNNKLELQTPDKPLRYYNLANSEEQFHDWAQCKVSLSVSINTDIPIRIFDALVTGQIPLVSSDLNGFDHFISPQSQVELPVVRFHRQKLEEVERAYQKALRLFDEGGLRQLVARHRYAMENHMMCNRLIRWFEVLEAA